MRTWHGEAGVVAAVLAGVVIATGGSYVEWIGAAAVLGTFCHAQVADRLAEKDAAREKPSVDCHKWATRYLVSKELLWLVYFIIHQSWSALAGVGLFLAFPLWRKWWRNRHPITHIGQEPNDVLNAQARQRLASLQDSDLVLVEALRVVVKATGGWPAENQPV